jgi:hypothetical protein
MASLRVLALALALLLMSSTLVCMQAIVSSLAVWLPGIQQ